MHSYTIPANITVKGPRRPNYPTGIAIFQFYSLTFYFYRRTSFEEIIFANFALVKNKSRIGGGYIY